MNFSKAAILVYIDDQLLTYYYMMIAEDLAGNITKTDLIPVSTVVEAEDDAYDLSPLVGV